MYAFGTNGRSQQGLRRIVGISVARGTPRLPSVLRYLVDDPERMTVDSPTVLAPITIWVDGRDNVRMVITIERNGEITGCGCPVGHAPSSSCSTIAGPAPRGQPEQASEPPPAGQRALSVEDEAHVYARERGLSRRLYAFVRFLAVVVLRGWFRVRVSGVEHIPAAGPAIVAPNHKNFLDAFFVGIATPRHVRYMAKIELFKGPLAWLFPRLGWFPVRRGEADEQALETARRILVAGGVVVVFPEGTRVEQADALGAPHHGAGRLALETGAPIIPAAITGTSHLWRGTLPKLRRVQLTFLPAVAPVDPPAGRDTVSELIDHRVWPAVQDEYGRLRARRGLIAAGLAAIGIGGGLMAKRQLDARRKPRLLGKVEPRRMRRHTAHHRLLRRLRSLR